MIKGCIFDVDGTLLDSMVIWESAGDKFLRKIGCVPEKDLAYKLKVLSINESAAYLKKTYNLNLDDQEIVTGINSVVEDLNKNEAQLKNGVFDFIKKLHDLNIKMCLATATDRFHIVAALSRCNVLEYFSDIITCTEVGKGKVSPDIYRQALEKLGTPKCETPIFEDALYAAKTAADDGFKVVGVYDEYEKHTEG